MFVSSLLNKNTNHDIANQYPSKNNNVYFLTSNINTSDNQGWEKCFTSQEAEFKQAKLLKIYCVFTCKMVTLSSKFQNFLPNTKISLQWAPQVCIFPHCDNQFSIVNNIT